MVNSLTPNWCNPSVCGKELIHLKPLGKEIHLPVYSVGSTGAPWQRGGSRLRAGAHVICLSSPLLGAQLAALDTGHMEQGIWVWKAHFLPPQHTGLASPIRKNVPNNPCAFITGMFTNILFLDSFWGSADDLLVGGSEKGEAGRGVRRQPDQIRGPATTLLSLQWPRNPPSPQIPASRLSGLEGQQVVPASKFAGFPI